MMVGAAARRSSIRRWFYRMAAAAAVLSICLAPAHAAHRRRRHHPHVRKPTPSPTPSPRPTPRVASVVVLAGGTGVVDTPTGKSPAVLDTAQIYNPLARKFVLIAPMTAHRDRDAAAVLPDGRLLIVGGVDSVLVPLISFPGPAMPWILQSAETLDPRSGRFAATAEMETARDEPTATMLRNGRVLIVGGGTNQAELYDEKTGKFAPTGDMAEDRSGQTATLLRNGKVLICGGGHRQAELYDPTSGKFAPTGSMSVNRIFHTATLLTDGRVLIAGGSPYARSAALDTT